MKNKGKIKVVAYCRVGNASQLTHSQDLECKIKKISQALNAPQQSRPFMLDRDSRKEEIAQILAEWDK